MSILPPLPSWDGLHPLVIHFPIALLLVAPLFVVFGLSARKTGRTFLIAAFVLVLLGVVATFFSVATGEAAGQMTIRTPEVNVVLHHHEELAERTRLVFAAMAFVMAALLFGPRLVRRSLEGRTAIATWTAFLVVYLAASLLLVSTAHNGGRLVHELGVQAMMNPEPLPGVPAGGGGASEE